MADISTLSGPPYPAIEREPYAGFWRRLTAFLVDLAMLTAIAYGLSYLLSAPFAVLAGLAVFLVYFTLFEASAWEATPGKKLLGLRVLDLDREPLSWQRALARNALKAVSAGSGLAGFVIAAWTPSKQAVHDLMASTLVLRRR